MKDINQSIPLYMLRIQRVNEKNFWGSEEIKKYYAWLYTTDVNERDHVLSLGYEYIAVAGNVFATQVTSSIPLYRLYNGNEHFYTASVAEKESAAQSGYTFERIACFVYPTQVSGSVPLYRRYNGFSHYYSIKNNTDGDPVEVIDFFPGGLDNPPQTITKNQPSNNEGIACYILPPG